jgi:hypothetical protein
MFQKDTRHIAFGIVVLGMLIVLYVVASLLQIVSIVSICASFLVGAFVLALVVPRLSPVQTTKYDEGTPVTNYILGNRMTFLSYNYLFIEIIVAAVMIRTSFDRLTMGFYIQAALLIVYLSLVGYMTARPGTAPVDGEDEPDQIPAARPVPNADDSRPIADDRPKIWINAVVKSQRDATDPKLKTHMKKVVTALRGCPQNSYESMNEVDYQINALVGELGYRVTEGKTDVAIECCQLICILIEQRTGLYQQIVDTRKQK